MKKTVKTTLIVGLAFMLLFLGGCKANQDKNEKKDNTIESENGTNEETKTEDSTNKESPDTQKPVQNTTEELGYSDVTQTDWPKTKYSVKEFDLGKEEYKLPTGKTMPYQLRGVIGMPEGNGPFPLVLITHGSHENAKENTRFDTGFAYLVEEFAKHGVIAVSMDLGQAYIWKYGDSDDRDKSVYMANNHLEHLIQAANAGESKYPVDLKNKIDFHNISLIGHSRGGESVLDIASNMSTQGYPVTSILCIAPTLLQADHTYPDSDVAIIVPEYDGDVVGLDGYILYDILNKNTIGTHLVTYLKGANHNYFNRNVKPNDSTILYKSDELKDQIGREAQENFLKGLALDYILGGLKGNKQPIAFDQRNPQPNTMYKQNVKVLLRRSDSNSLLDASKAENYSLENTIASYVTDSWWYQIDEVPVDTITSGQGDQKTRGLLKVTWNQKPSEIKFKPNITDLSKFKSLSIDLLVDPTDDANKNITNQQFNVRLVDETGNTATVSLPDKLNVLDVPTGTLKTTEVEDKEIPYWSKTTPLGGLILPLDSFTNVQLDKITSIELVFDHTSSGSILIGDITAQ